MNVTFLIGNGFDRNLGLATTYSEFVGHYKNTERTSEVLKKFREDISEEEELWSSAEVALGAYTAKFEAGQGEVFAECHIDICEELAEYLKKEQAKVDYAERINNIQAVCKKLGHISAPFPTQERTILNNIYHNRRDEQWVYNFICFNYTDTLDRLLENAGKEKDSLGSHRFNNNIHSNRIGQLCHVHGTVDKEMVFGVNDDTQIGKNEIFECEDGDIYKNLLIKRSANASYLEDTDNKATTILNDSQIVYIYGMSLGITDRIWWERICTWLDARNDRHLIVQKYSMPSKGAMPAKYQIAERRARQEITSYVDWDAVKKRRIEQRIHITDDNIFEAIKDIGITCSEEAESESTHNEENNLISLTVV